MVSGVSFKNPSAQEKQVRRHGTSSGLLFSFLLLLIAGLLYAGALFYRIAAQEKNTKLTSMVTQNNEVITGLLAGAPAEYVARSRAVDSMLYTQEATEKLLLKLHDLAVPGVVFKNFVHAHSDESNTNTMSITADADEFDTIAEQINSWKKSPLFTSVHSGDISRDEETGFILFTTEFELAPSAKGPFGENAEVRAVNEIGIQVLDNPEL